MAGERLGRLYEGYIVASLRAGSENAPEVHWNASIPDLMVQPDVVVGPVAAATTVVLITQSGARRGWDKKFWRNVGEVFDIRASLPTASIASITLGTEVKEELVSALEQLVDTHVFPSRNDRARLENCLVPLVAKAPKDFEEMVTWLTIEIQSIHDIAHIGELIRAACIRTSMSQPRWESLSGWASSRSQQSDEDSAEWSPPGAMRRGMAKIIATGSPQEVLNHINFGTKRTSNEVGQAFATNGWASRSIAGWRITDPEIIDVLNAFDAVSLLRVLEGALSPELQAVCSDIQSDVFLRSTAIYLRENAALLSDYRWIYNALIQSREDPTMGSLLEDCPNLVAGCWLFRALFALIKVAANLKQGYGYEQFIRDVRHVEADTAIVNSLIESGATREKIKKAGTTDSLRRKLVDWVSGLKPTDLETWQVLLVSQVLARRFACISVLAREQAAIKLADFLRRTTYEDRIAPYRYFEPILVLIEQTLSDQKIAYNLEPRCPTLISEMEIGRGKAGTTPIVRVGNSLIHWKSAHGSHTNDKTKELCGRAFSLKFRISMDGNQLESARGVQTLVIVLDGSFDKDDVRHLIRCGWDHVVPSTEALKIVNFVR